MERVREILEELELEGLLEGEFAAEVRIHNMKRNSIREMHGKSQGLVWYLVRGWIKGVTYFGNGGEIKWDLGEGNWFGFEEAILGSDLIYDIEAMRECEILEVPLRKIYNSPNTHIEVFRVFMWHMAMNKKSFEDLVIDRIGFSDEGFFLKYLENNGFSISYRSQQDISDVLAINTRTFQRILKALDERGIITIRRGSVRVPDREKFYEYIEEKGLWK